MSRLEPNEQYDYYKHQSVYISDYIKVADNKAGITLSVTSVFFAFMINEMKGLWKKGFDASVYKDWHFYGYSASSVFLLLGIFFLARTIWPNFPRSKAYYHSWGGIAHFAHASGYNWHLNRFFRDKEKFLEKMAEQNHSLARVCLKKFKNLKRSYRLLAIGALISFATWLVS